MKTLAAILLLLALTACATVDQLFGTRDGLILAPLPEPDETSEAYEGLPLGEEVPAPWGYTKHCIDFPDSVFCP